MTMLSAGLLLSSCAYVQTHKNIEEIGVHYEGELLDTESMELYEHAGKWYITAHKADFKLSYPIVHDSVFRKNNSNPSFDLISSEGRRTAYHPISSYAADILRKSDGYFQLNAIADEIKRTPGEWTESLPGATKHAIAAELAGAKQFYIEDKRVPATTPIGSKILSKIDFVIVDIPATLVYNVAIPVMAPFVFFSEFLSKE